MELYSDEYFMNEALKEAQKAFEKGEVPVGAVVVCQNKVIGRGFNLTETLNDVTAHAEMQAISAAANYLGAKYLRDCTLFVSLEPCVMCAGALFWSQISKLVYGASDPKRGFLKTGPELLHPKTRVQGGLLEEACAKIMRSFFEARRQR